MQTQIVKLSFIEPVHFGDGRLSSGLSSCDAGTLFSALFIEALHLGVSEILLEAAKGGAFGLSDAFPYVGSTYYLPKPMVRIEKENLKGDSVADSRARKAAKKLEHIAVRDLVPYLGGSFDSEKALDDLQLGQPFVQTKVNLTRSYKDDADPYQIGGFSFFSGAGLYFFVQGDFDMHPILESLSYSGLGGKRSSGYGRFEFEIVNDSWINELFSKGLRGDVGYLLLSSALPTDAELRDELLEGAKYRLIRKGGFVQSAAHSASSQKKRDSFVFAAGSLFRKPFTGAVYDVNATQGAHPVYRYARAMWIEV